MIYGSPKNWKETIGENNLYVVRQAFVMESGYGFSYGVNSSMCNETRMWKLAFERCRSPQEYV